MTLPLDFVWQAIKDNSLVLKCSMLHPKDSCNQKFLHQLINTTKSMWKIYLAVHLIPLIVFKRKKLRQHFLKEMSKFIVGYVKSMLFAGLYLAIVRRSICLFTQISQYQSNHAAPTGFIGGVSLLFESPSRQCEIALYCLNKSMETSYYWLRRRGIVGELPYGEVLVFGFAMALLGYFYLHDKDNIKRTNLHVMSKFLGEI